MRLALAVLATLASLHAAADPAHYTVRVDGTSVHVRAELPAGDGKLLIGTGGGIDQLPDQWATFTRNLRVTHGGTAVTVTSNGASGWLVPAATPLVAEYDVDLAYAREKWPAGNEQSGKLFSSGSDVRALYTITKPLFLFTSTQSESAIRFELPAGWRVAAPWPVASNGEFAAANIEALTGNSIVIGEFAAAEVRAGAFDAVLVTPDLTAVPAELQQALRVMGAEAGRLFPETPRGRYVMTLFRDEQEDGESFADSAALTSPEPFDRESMIVTGNTVVHELLHHWFGGMLRPVEHDSIAWFTEGFTEYYANRIVAGSGTVAPERIRAKVDNMVTGYLYFFESSLFRGVTLAAAGQKKGAYRFGVYNGGWAIAFSLDVMLRQESGGKNSLDDVLRLLFRDYGASGKPITPADIQHAASAVAEHDLAPFFAKYVDTREELPIADTLRAIGITLRGQPYAADLYLVDAPAMTGEQRALRAALFGAL